MFAPHVFYVGEVAVLPDCSYPGMGISLVKALINAARQDGFTTFFTVTGSEHRAVKWTLEKLDFTLVESGSIDLGEQKSPVDFYKMEIHGQSAPEPTRKPVRD
jgi:N-acetylglutamate synthase-like GNAT family acetyltransferase